MDPLPGLASLKDQPGPLLWTTQSSIALSFRLQMSLSVSTLKHNSPGRNKIGTEQFRNISNNEDNSNKAVYFGPEHSSNFDNRLFEYTIFRRSFVLFGIHSYAAVHVSMLFINWPATVHEVMVMGLAVRFTIIQYYETTSKHGKFTFNTVQ